MPGDPVEWADLQAMLTLALQAPSPGLHVQVLDEVDSTNTRLLERARHDPTPCLLVAARQTAGRGRLGRPWQTQPGASLSFSIGLPLAPQRWEGLSLAVGLALADALDPPDTTPSNLPSRHANANPATPALGLKWPNDLWRWEGPGLGRKLGGVLIETTLQHARQRQQRYCVVGVGLNIAPLAAPGAEGRACLQELQPRATPAAALLQVAAPLLQALRTFETAGFAPLVAAYARRDLLRGQAVRTTAQADHTGGPGIAEGVDSNGALIVRGERLQRIMSGEVSVRFSHNPLPVTPTC